jgi:hypothetical protein
MVQSNEDSPVSEPLLAAKVNVNDQTSFCQSILMSSPIWEPRQDLFTVRQMQVLLIWGAFSDERTELSFTLAVGPHKRSHSWVQNPQDSWPHFTVRDLKLLQFGSDMLPLHILSTDNIRKKSFSTVLLLLGVYLLPWARAYCADAQQWHLHIPLLWLFCHPVTTSIWNTAKMNKTATNKCTVHFLTVTLPDLVKSLLFFISSPPQYQAIYITVWPPELPGGCISWCTYTWCPILCWSEVQCQKNSHRRNWTAVVISWANKRDTTDCYKGNA